MTKSNSVLNKLSRETSYEVIKIKLDALVAYANLITDAGLQDLILERIATIQNELNFLQTDELKNN